MKSFFIILFFPLSFLHATGLHHEDRMPHDHDTAFTYAGDILQVALPTVGILTSAYTKSDDELYNLQLVVETGMLLQSCHHLKEIFRETPLGTRPNGHHSSFPSGHTTFAFYGARLIHKAHGLEYGLPAYGLAALTAYSRVEGRYHHVRDVVAGALLAFSIDYLADESFAKIKTGTYPTYHPYTKKAGVGYGVQFEWSF